MKLLPLIFLALLTPKAQAENLCASEASLRPSIQYCDENWNFLAPAHACVDTYQALLAKEQPRIQKLMDAAKTMSNSAQDKNFNNHAKAVQASLAEVTYLVDYGKQVHTELEMYGNGLVPPIFDASERGDPSDPKFKAIYMSRECYSDPIGELGKMEAQLRPQIQSLEKLKAQLQGMALASGSSKTDLNTISNEALPTGHSSGTAGSAPGYDPYSASSISGHSNDQPSH